MAAITATDWTVTEVFRGRPGGTQRKRNGYTIVLASGGTYPSNGIPRPTNGKLGLVRNLDYILIGSQDGTAHLVQYDDTNETFRIFTLASTGGAELATTVTMGSAYPQTLYVEAVGW